MGFALAVTYPAAGNLGGGGFLVGSIGREKETSETPQENLSSVALDFREVAPLQSTSDMYVKAKESSSLLGHLASGVPGSVDGLLHALDSWGSMSRDQVLAPAIRLAKDGFPMTQRTHSMLARKSTMNAMLKYRLLLICFIPRKTSSTGTLFKQPDLARTLDLIRQKGREGFYSGDVADHLADRNEKRWRTHLSQGFEGVSFRRENAHQVSHLRRLRHQHASSFVRRDLSGSNIQSS